ncbi:hypothetical protein [Orientia tsutsugamushi]|uniref:hypothetical protein n=1 Tax=Orientia tsutsugamushi TaxID=784 RepID=UPI001E47108A|nr:hypothetical protein [Orientia tsutsugamushi]
MPLFIYFFLYSFHIGILCTYFLRSCYTAFIRDLYKDFNINTVTVVYSINEQRNPVNELIITNYKTC